MREMKSSGWNILILLCTASFLTSFAHQDSEMLIRSTDLLISSEKLSLANIQEKHDCEHARKLAAAEEISMTGKGQKGKGAYGGANVVHRRPDKSAVASYRRPCFFAFSAVILGFTFLPYP